MTENGIRVKGYKRLFNEITGKVFGTGNPEVAIKNILYQVLGCYDITPAQRAEAIKLLAMASTALTTKQRRKFDREL